MSGNDPADWIEYQQNEIDEVADQFKTISQFLTTFYGMRGADVSGPKRAYLQGVHDAMLYGRREVNGIDNLAKYVVDRLEKAAQYDARKIPDERTSNLVQTLVSEGANENYGNVRVNAENLVDYLSDAHKSEINPEEGGEGE